MFEDRFHMTQAENIFLAKRNLVDSIWKSAQLEGINVTFPDTHAIVERAVVQNLPVDDVEKILNLREAWRFVLNTLDEPLELDWLCRLHGFVGRGEALNAGYLRDGDVGIAGTSWQPPLPHKAEITQGLDTILNPKNSITQQALDLLFWLMKSQLFWDGNKRTAILAANKLTITNGAGVIAVPVELITEFNAVLSTYYEKQTEAALFHAQEFIYTHAIEGITR